VEIKFKPSWKQHLAWQLLEDKKTKQVAYGGGAGSGKTWLGSSWKIYRRLTYPKTRGLIAREKMVDITDSVLVTYRKVLGVFGLENNKDYKYNGNDHEFTFSNGSTEKFTQMPWIPSDPDYEYLGSKEYTDFWAEEASEIQEKGVEIAGTRIRWMLGEHGLIPKTLITCNSNQGWIYKEFYLPDRDGRLEDYRALIRALVTDNPDPEFVKIYLDSLNNIKDPVTRARLRDGDWEYATDDRVLYYHDKLISAFHNKYTPDGKACLTVDTSRYGKDSTIIWRYSGLRAKQRYVVYHSRTSGVDPTSQVVNKVKELEEAYSIPRCNVIVDEMGAGGPGVVDGLQGCVNFVGSSRPILAKEEPGKKIIDLIGTRKPQFDSLKAQCAFYLADKLNGDEFAIEEESRELQNKIIEEALAHKKKAVDSGKKLGITPKDKICDILKRSPDDWDNFIMRMVLEIKPQPLITGLRTFGKRETFDDLFG